MLVNMPNDEKALILLASQYAFFSIGKRFFIDHIARILYRNIFVKEFSYEFIDPRSYRKGNVDCGAIYTQTSLIF